MGIQNNIQNTHMYVPLSTSLQKSLSFTSRVGTQALWDTKCPNYDISKAGDSRIIQLYELEEFRNHAYENAKMYKEQTKNGMLEGIKRGILGREVGSLVQFQVEVVPWKAEV